MSEQSEAVKRIQSVLTTMEQKRADVDKAVAGINQLQIVKERAELALQNARIQLAAEIKKFDPHLEIVTTEDLEPANA